MTIFSAYVIATGLFTGRQIIGTADALALNSLEGEAWHEGECDPLAQAIEFVTDDFGDLQPVLVDYQPPAPSDDEWQTWSWDVVTRRWLPTPTLALLKRRVAEPVLDHLVVLDLRLARPLGEIVEAMLASTTPPSAAVDKLTATNATKQALRDYLDAVDDAADETALTDIPPPTLD